MESKYRYEQFDPSRWQDLVSVLGSDGGSGGCWCMSWRSREPVNGESAKASLKALVQQNKVHGVLAYFNDEPVAWTTFGEKSSFYQANNHPDFQENKTPKCFSIPCFFVKESHRGKGLSKQLLEQAIVYSKGQGAEVLESYPVKPTEPNEVRTDWAFTGSMSLFESKGFECSGSCKYELQSMRLDLKDVR